MNFFEATTEQKQLAAIGRQMQDYSEDFGKQHGLGHLKDEGLRVLNELSNVGAMLSRYGVTFGTTFADFTEQDLQLIAKFMKNEITNEYLKELK